MPQPRLRIIAHIATSANATITVPGRHTVAARARQPARATGGHFASERGVDEVRKTSLCGSFTSLIVVARICWSTLRPGRPGTGREEASSGSFRLTTPQDAEQQQQQQQWRAKDERQTARVSTSHL